MEPSENQQVIARTDLPAYIRGYHEAVTKQEQDVVSELAKAGHKAVYRSTGRTITYKKGSNEIIVSEGEASITAQSQEALQLQLKHQQTLELIEKDGRARIKKLEEESRLAIKAIFAEHDEAVRRAQEEAEKRERQLASSTASKELQIEQQREKNKRMEQMASDAQLSLLNKRLKDEEVRVDAERQRKEEQLREFTSDMQQTLNSGLTALQNREEGIDSATRTARTTYEKSVQEMERKLSRARESLYS